MKAQNLGNAQFASTMRMVARALAMESAPVRNHPHYGTPSRELPVVAKIDGKYSIESAKWCMFNGQAQWVVALENGLYRHNDTYEQLEASIAKRNAEVAAEVAKNNADIEFRMEVIAEMEAAGIAKHVALNRTANHKGLMDSAREFGVI